MGLKKYFAKIKKFFAGKREKISGNLLKYEKELINLYNNLILSFEKFYSGFYGEKLSFAPLTPIRRNYEDLFSENIRREFDIYETGKGLVVRRKGLEQHL